MDRYQLATLSSWGGEHGIQGRKRLQKVVFFLQTAGCPLNCRFTLHHYGPYSRDVADACDEMVAVGLLQEQVSPNKAGTQYNYALSQQTIEQLAATTKQYPARAALMNPFQDLGTKLLSDDLWQLELGSTILFFFQQSQDWGHALQRACDFKKVAQDADATLAALELAQDVSNKGNAQPA